MLSVVVTIWTHVIGHSTQDSALSSHIAPVMLLSSIVTLTGIVVFFILNFAISFTRYIMISRHGSCCLRLCKGGLWSGGGAEGNVSSPYEYYDSDMHEHGNSSRQHRVQEMDNAFHGQFVIEGDTADGSEDGFHNKATTEDTKGIEDDGVDCDSEQDCDSDMDAYAYTSSGLVEYEHTGANSSESSYKLSKNACGNQKGASHIQRKNSTEMGTRHVRTGKQRTEMVGGDIFTVSMIWSNVYGLGAACFVLMPIMTMASSLCTFSFLLGLNAASVFEAIQERRDPQYKFKQWSAGKRGARVRNTLHTCALLLANVSIIMIGANIFSMQMNQAGYIKVDDVFLGIIAPHLTPIILRGVRRPHTTILCTMEVALPFTAFMACMCIISMIGMGLKPFEMQHQLARNMVAVTILLPGFFGIVIMYTLHCTFRRRMLYILCTFLVVFVGKQFTFSRDQPAVIGSFVLSAIAFGIVLATSSKSTMKILGKH